MVVIENVAEAGLQVCAAIGGWLAAISLELTIGKEGPHIFTIPL